MEHKQYEEKSKKMLNIKGSCALANRYGNDKRDVYRWWTKHSRAPAQRVDPVLLVIIWTRRKVNALLSDLSLCLELIGFVDHAAIEKNLNLKRNQYLQFHTFRKGKKNIWLSGRDYIVVRRITCPTYLLNRDKFIEWNFEKDTEARKRETIKYAKRSETQKVRKVWKEAEVLRKSNHPFLY